VKICAAPAHEISHSKHTARAAKDGLNHFGQKAVQLRRKTPRAHHSSEGDVISAAAVASGSPEANEKENRLAMRKVPRNRNKYEARLDRSDAPGRQTQIAGFAPNHGMAAKCHHRRGGRSGSSRVEIADGNDVHGWPEDNLWEGTRREFFKREVAMPLPADEQPTEANSKESTIASGARQPSPSLLLTVRARARSIGARTDRQRFHCSRPVCRQIGATVSF